MKRLSFSLKIFIAILYAFTLFSLYYFINTGYVKIDPLNYAFLLFFSALVALTESFSVSYNRMSCSTSFAVELASFMLFGPLFTIIVEILGFTFRVIKFNGGYKHLLNTPIYGTFINYCFLILPTIYGNYFYQIVGGASPIGTNSVVKNIPQILLFGIIFFIINTITVSFLSSLIVRKNFSYTFVNNVKIGLLNIIAMIPFGIILSIVFGMFSYMGVLIILFPIVLVRYTFSIYTDSKYQYVQTVDAFMNAIEARDKYTEGHSKRVAELSTKLARELGYRQGKIEQLNIAALLHDIGKIGISDNILNKPGKLTNEEFNAIKEHPQIGHNIIKDIKNLDYAMDIVKYHHEKYAGGGYPTGKPHNELPLDVFIVQLADSIDAMGSDRPYRNALNDEEIIAEIKKHTGEQFHPRVVEAYFRLLEKEKKR